MRDQRVVRGLRPDAARVGEVEPRIELFPGLRRHHRQHHVEGQVRRAPQGLAVRRPVTEGRDAGRVPEVQRLDHVHAPEGRQAVRVNPVLPHVRLQGRDPHHLVGREVLQRHAAAVRLHRRHGPFRPRARVHVVGALLGDGLEGARHARLAEHLPFLDPRAVRIREHGLRLRQARQRVLARLEEADQARVERDPRRGNVDRRGEEVPEVQLAVAAVRRLHGPHEAAHQRGAPARFVGAVHFLFRTHADRAGNRHRIVVAEHRVPARVERDDLVGRGVVMHHGHDAEVADHRPGAEGHLRERGGHGGIDRRPALAQRLEARALGEGVVAARHRALPALRHGIAGEGDVLQRQVGFPFPRGPPGRRQVDRRRFGPGHVRRPGRARFLRATAGQHGNEQGRGETQKRAPRHPHTSANTRRKFSPRMPRTASSGYPRATRPRVKLTKSRASS